jgi:hypothetical protein
MRRLRMTKRRKRTKRGEQYLTIAAGYQLLRSPLADSYRAAAEHYRYSDPPVEEEAEAEVEPAPEREQSRH